MPFSLAIPRHNISLNRAECFELLRAVFGKPAPKGKVAEFERQFAEYIGADFGIAFSSGTASLYHGLQASGLQSGDKIIVPEYEFSSVIETIRMLKLEPVFAAVDATNGNLTARTLQEAWSEDVRAVLVAHVHGNAAPMDEIAGLCRQRNVLLIEDCAHSTGATWNGRRVGTFGNFAIFSFGDGKSLTTCGGGMIVTSDSKLAEKLRQTQQALTEPRSGTIGRRAIKALLKWALSTRLGFSLTLFPIAWSAARLFGINIIDRLFHRGVINLSERPTGFLESMTGTDAAVGLSQLSRIDQLNRQRIDNASIIRRHLQASSAADPEPVHPNSAGVALNLRLRLNNADRFSVALLEQGVDVRRDYLMVYDNDHPMGVVQTDNVFLPNHPGISSEDAHRIGQTAAAILQSQR